MSDAIHTPVHRLSLCLPAYNEAAAIGTLIEQAAEVLTGETDQWRIIVVDDGSQDQTAAEVEHAGESLGRRIRLIRHDRNRGLGPAVLTGLREALTLSEGSDHLVVCMDADLTHPPQTIPALRLAAEAGADLVIASRFRPGSRQIGVPVFRRLLSLGARALFHIGLRLPGVRDYTCGFRAIRASLLARAFEQFGADGLITRAGFACTDELLVRLALLDATIREVPFTLRYDRKRGSSKMNLSLTLFETLRLVMTHCWQYRVGGKGRDRDSTRPD